MKAWYGVYEDGYLVDIKEFNRHPNHPPEVSDFDCNYDSRTRYEVKKMDVKPSQSF